MPFYTYRCPRCGVTTETQRKIAERDTKLPECVECHHPMHLAPSAPSPSFPGADSWRGR